MAALAWGQDAESCMAPSPSPALDTHVPWIDAAIPRLVRADPAPRTRGFRS